MCTTCPSGCGCGCGLLPVDCCCYPKKFCHQTKKAKLELENDSEIVYESDEEEENNGYDVEKNDYPLEQLQKDFDKMHESEEFKRTHDILFEQMKRKYPERVKKRKRIEPLPIVCSPSMSDMLTRGQLKCLIKSYESHIEDFLRYIPDCEDDYPAYYEVQHHMNYFYTSDDFKRIVNFYEPSNEYPNYNAKFCNFLYELLDCIVGKSEKK